ncbi:MAG: asparagine synthase (glutamine-hydrolyzing) [Desulfobacterales bacterium]|uniref:asparagine synthase (glutamine-hydrolyzing) n=1 Tax=Candidatus Desulfatibia vada TaxID=2841696 RepID=A0A8J6P2Z4_9BACT|nr:asparagine synthase (glutamine-hydrolyzing) [Candidatus Desulfatibia vada]MBL7218312.1 asparagine synthase (glutamine-hydrolyzing) [Desulfobacteraceae bacterium]
MFAFALWDREDRRLTLARDRLGEKPLYYGWQGNVFIFGSELKVLRAHPAFQGEIDRRALALFLRYNYIPAPYSIYKGIHKLLPGTYLAVRSGARGAEPTTYWSAKKMAETGQGNLFAGDDGEAGEELERLLRRAVSSQMVADVPLGAFLSGGVDSSTIVSLMQAQSSRPVKTFTIGSYSSGYNEAEQAKKVARHLGTEHTELYVTPEEAMAVIPRLPELYDEPFADSSQIPTFLVANLARNHVTVALSGDGGDELFGGYNRHYWVPRFRRRFGPVPRPLRVALAAGLSTLTPHTWNSVFRGLAKLSPEALRYVNPGDKLHKLAEVLPARSAEEMYQGLVSFWKRPEKVVVFPNDYPHILFDVATQPDLKDFSHLMMYLDLVSYLPDDILAKVDRAAMGVSLETRVPMLDHRVVEFSWRLPLSMKIREGQGKWLLRQLLYKYVPRTLVERPKMGFGVPLDAWLRGPLKEWAEALLAKDRLKREGFLNPLPVREKWNEHLSGRRNWAYHLWGVLMFQAWLESRRSEV